MSDGKSWNKLWLFIILLQLVSISFASFWMKRMRGICSLANYWAINPKQSCKSSICWRQCFGWQDIRWLSAFFLTPFYMFFHSPFDGYRSTQFTFVSKPFHGDQLPFQGILVTGGILKHNKRALGVTNLQWCIAEFSDMVKNIHTAFRIQGLDAGKICPDTKGRDSDLEYTAGG